MSKAYNQFIDMLGNYSYGPAYELMIEYGYKETDVALILRAFKHSINFDFDYAEKVMQKTSVQFKHEDLYKDIRQNLDKLIEGEPEAIFSELMFSMVTQITKDEYIDLMGRLYRYREALLKYLFLQTQGKKNISMLSENMSKRYQIKILREKYGMHSHNLGVALTKYFKKYHSNDHAVTRVMEILDSDKMIDLMNLRNASIIGHGFVGISKIDIIRTYDAEIEDLLYDFKACIGFLGMNLEYDKYDKWNNAIIVEAKKIENFLDSNFGDDNEW